MIVEAGMGCQVSALMISIHFIIPSPWPKLLLCSWCYTPLHATKERMLESSIQNLILMYLQAASLNNIFLQRWVYEISEGLGQDSQLS